MIITHILRPDQYTASVIAKTAGIPEDYARYVVYELGARGIVGPGGVILEPSRFNSETIAKLLAEKSGGPDAWIQFPEGARLALIDSVERFLDTWQQQGVIG